jgi:hypothetical protein
MTSAKTDEMNYAISDAIAASTIFSTKEVYDCYEACHSWDLVLIACTEARITGVSLIRTINNKINEFLRDTQ